VKRLINCPFCERYLLLRCPKNVSYLKFQLIYESQYLKSDDKRLFSICLSQNKIRYRTINHLRNFQYTQQGGLELFLPLKFAEVYSK